MTALRQRPVAKAAPTVTAAPPVNASADAIANEAGAMLARAKSTVPNTEAKKGNKPAFALKHDACSIAVYANPRKKDATIQYKFTLARSAFSKGEFKTLYSFRPQDVEALVYLISQAADYIADQSKLYADNDAAMEDEE